ncbi:MAG: cell division protein FtsH [Candidatus Terrybacteria bacterium RIFCSPHIGHO2_01_FULL_48_17]|uniref:ATP-dependent zinc metalloprotease FtsH n=1 Tax=Candidatus Terrybacteria bacterium RIFCSPHIGHO2_01_FULL_48_17 TaxID=1802362 RepID=A0A1G2PL28_9BACT|nr:MAG: cell division protein FtsH [Candidatus Terrybacteria bacterium RIFCSPHIGHO2_01_FULL_48_17]OHA52659.1 MAG: cell division protein FtsH [Candidatus Terrybacteria bacterium RIFCSPLOWO2_01_FULL_48_14]
MKGFTKQLIVVIVVLFALSAIFSIISARLQKPEDIAISQVATEIQEKKVKRLVVESNKVTIERTEGPRAQARKEDESSITETLDRFGVSPEELRNIEIVTKEPSGIGVWLPTLLSIFLPILIILGIFWFFTNRAQQSTMQAFSFGKVRAKIFSSREQKERATFADVAGVQEAKEELQEVVEFLKFPQKFLTIGARIPRGVLLVGPPGSGKTLLARAVAGEADVPFFHISGSEFVEMFVGVGASRVRDLFEQAKRTAPSIVFIDEIDAVGRMRGTGLGGGHDEREQTLNQILVEMDGFDRATNVIVMAATNRPDVLDPALLRPGRFDRHVMLDQPDIKAREEILRIHAKEKKLSPDVNFRAIAERTPGFSGADLANLMNEAAILAARRNKQNLTQLELSESIDKVMLGPERKSKVLSEKEKEIAAYHEAGHALIAASIPGADPVHKVSIVSRGMAGGYTQQLPTEDRRLHSRSEFLARLAVLLGGYASEELVFNELTTGASNDLRIASDLTRKLVCEYGMSEKLGPVVYTERQEMVFLGRELAEKTHYSEEISQIIDKEIERVIREAHLRAKRILTQKRSLLEKIAQTLIKQETLEREEFERVIGKKLPPTTKNKAA